MPRYDKIPTYLTQELCQVLMRVPPDLSDREIARYYTFTEQERELINRLGFTVQLALLRFPGRTLMEIKEVPKPVLSAIADQLGVVASAFAEYGERENTLYEHLDELRRECGFRSCGWKEYLLVARSLLADAMESDRPLPLIETALERLRTEEIIAPNLIHVERLVWIVLKTAERRLFATLAGSLSLEQRTRLDGLLFADATLRGATRLSWLRQASEVASPKSVKQIVERLLFLRSLELPALPASLHQNRVLQLARKGRVRSGDVAVGGSRRYRSFENYLLPAPHFAQLAEQQQTRLAVGDDAASYLAAKQRGIQEKLAALQESISKVEGSLVLDDKGKLHLPPLDKAVPEDVERLQGGLYAMLPHLPLLDLLLEVENWTGFLKHFTHLTSGDAPVGKQKLELVAALMGMGMNLGLGKMADSCPRELSTPTYPPGTPSGTDRYTVGAQSDLRPTLHGYVGNAVKALP